MVINPIELFDSILNTILNENQFTVAEFKKPVIHYGIIESDKSSFDITDQTFEPEEDYLAVCRPCPERKRYTSFYHNGMKINPIKVVTKEYVTFKSVPYRRADSRVDLTKKHVSYASNRTSIEDVLEQFKYVFYGVSLRTDSHLQSCHSKDTFINYRITNYDIYEDCYADVSLELIICKYYCPLCYEKINVFDSFLDCSAKKDITITEKIYNTEKSIVYYKKFFTLYRYKDVSYNSGIYCNKIIFNKDTYALYVVKNQFISGKKVAKHKKIFKNVTYNSVFLCEVPIFQGICIRYLERFEPRFCSYIKQEKCIEYNDNFSSRTAFNSYPEYSIYWANNTYKRNLICLAHIYKYYNVKNIKMCIFLFNLYFTDKTIFSKIRNKSYKEMLSYFGFNSKLLHEITDQVTFTRSLSNAYFLCYKIVKDPNTIRKLLRYDLQLPCSKLCNYNNFVYQYYKGNSNGILNLFCNDHDRYGQSYYLNDSVYMYYKIKEICRDYTIDFKKRSVEYIHDMLSSDYNKLRHENKKIPKDKILKAKLEDFTIDNIKYSLAIDTHQLIDVGTRMNICVGSYGTRAVSQSCYIFLGYNESNEPVTCIEINKLQGEYYVCQVKKTNNRLPDYEEAKKIYTAFDSRGIKFNTCDLRSYIQDTKPYQMSNIAY